MKRFSLAFVVAVVCSLAGGWLLQGQTASPSANVQFSDGSSATVADSAAPLGIQPRALLNITIQFTPDAIGEPVVVDTLDGGSASIASSLPVVNNDATITFQLIAAPAPGSNSITLRAGSATFRLQLWVMDSVNPQNNPSGLTTVSHE